MNLSSLTDILLSDSTMLAAIPAAILCYIPMRNQRRFKVRYMILHCGLIFIAAVILSLRLNGHFPNLDGTVAFLPFLGAFFVYYCLSVYARVSRCAGIFFCVCALLAIASYGAYLIDADAVHSPYLQHTDNLFALVQLGLTILIGIPTAFVFWKWGIFIVDHLQNTFAWGTMALMSMIVFTMLCIVAPQQYENFAEPGISGTLIMVYVLISVLYFLEMVIFAQVSSSIIQRDELQTQETIYRMQREQYKRIQSQSENMRILRHDFKHSIGVLTGLAEENDMDGIKHFLSQYAKVIPGQKVVQYCDSDMINTILNYYAERAESSNIKMKVFVDIPLLSDDQTFAMVSLLGNLLDNSIQGCETVPEEEREIEMRIVAMNQENLYLVISNSFDGVVRKQGGRYLSTRRKQGGSGIGLRSIKEIALRYDGQVEFYHKGRTFHVDLNMKIDPAEEKK